MTPAGIPRFELRFNDQPVCDFCSDPDVRWRYPAQDFIDLDVQEPRITTESCGDWAACAACHALIERNDRDALAKRTADHRPSFAGIEIPYDVAIEYARNLHAKFFEHRTGPALPYAA